ncbi:MAG TPA: hypothetical protein PLL75_01495 [Candidatus Omnitrophota bacterium]|nr:hypothetical protein [Candidatus Omnitrophota bacterium]HPS36388.1 hypothetical protein [Candidatus Omnitrophota bacterium]
MSEQEKFPLVKLIVLIILTGVLVFLLLPHFSGKSKRNVSRRIVSTQGDASLKRPLLPPNFENLPPKIQEMIRKRIQRTQAE